MFINWLISSMIERMKKGEELFQTLISRFVNLKNEVIGKNSNRTLFTVETDERWRKSVSDCFWFVFSTWLIRLSHCVYGLETWVAIACSEFLLIERIISSILEGLLPTSLFPVRDDRFHYLLKIVVVILSALKKYFLENPIRNPIDDIPAFQRPTSAWISFSKFSRSVLLNVEQQYCNGEVESYRFVDFRLRLISVDARRWRRGNWNCLKHSWSSLIARARSRKSPYLFK